MSALCVRGAGKDQEEYRLVIGKVFRLFEILGTSPRMTQVVDESVRWQGWRIGSAWYKDLR